MTAAWLRTYAQQHMLRPPAVLCPCPAALWVLQSHGGAQWQNQEELAGLMALSTA